MKILFLTSRLPFPPIGGDRLRTFNFIKYLSKNHKVTLISFIENTNELDNIERHKKYVEKLITIKLSRLSSITKSFFGIFSRTPIQTHYYSSSLMKRFIKKELANEYDIIF